MKSKAPEIIQPPPDEPDKIEPSLMIKSPVPLSAHEEAIVDVAAQQEAKVPEPTLMKRSP